MVLRNVPQQSHCPATPQMNFCSILDHGLILPLSHIAGKSSSWCVSTHGQNLSWSAAITDWTKGWFRCISRYFPRLSTLIGVVILKSSGWSVIVFIASALSNSLIGGHGNGNLNSVQPIAWLFLVSASKKTNPHLYCGTNLISSSQSSPFPSLLSNLPFPPNHIRCSSDSAGTSGDRVSSLAAWADVVIATLPAVDGQTPAFHLLHASRFLPQSPFPPWTLALHVVLQTLGMPCQQARYVSIQDLRICLCLRGGCCDSVQPSDVLGNSEWQKD